MKNLNCMIYFIAAMLKARKAVVSVASVLIVIFFMFLYCGEDEFEFDVDEIGSGQLEAPTDFRATVGGSSRAELSWSAVEGASSYNLYRAENAVPAEDAGHLKDGIKATHYTDEGMVDGKRYQYQVSAVDAEGTVGRRSEAIPMIPLPRKPATPKSLDTNSSNQQITLTWNAVAGANLYRVYRDCEIIHVGEVTEATFTDMGLTNDQSYTYTVSSVIDLLDQDCACTVNSDKSESITAVVPASQSIMGVPNNVRGTIGNGQVTLRWNGVVGANRYKVYRNNNSVGEVTEATFTDTGLTNGSYSYTISSVNASGVESTQSSSIMLTSLPDKPDTPVHLVASSGDQQITLTWDAVMGVDLYRVYRNGVAIHVAEVTEATFTDTNLTHGDTYTYTVSSVINFVQACAGKVEGDKSEQVQESPRTVVVDYLSFIDTRYFTGTSVPSTGSIFSDSDITHMFPGAASPFGMVAISPVNAKSASSFNPYNRRENGSRYKWGYYPNNASQRAVVKAFSTTAVSGMGCSGDLAMDFPFMVYPGDKRNKELDDTVSSKRLGALALKNNNFETSTVGEPGYFKATFASGMTAEVVANKRSGIAKFVLPSTTSKATFFFTTASRHVRVSASLQKRTRDRKTIIEGTIRNRGFCAPHWGNYTIYMVAELEQTASNVANASATSLITSSSNLWQMPFVFDLNSSGQTIQMKFGLSYVNLDGAYANLQTEIPNWNFAQQKQDVQANWNKFLGRIKVEDDTATQADKEIFYTSLYRALLHPDTFSDADGKYIGFNNSIYTTERVGSGDLARNRIQYQLFSGWDTYRAQMQLVTLVDSHIASDMAQSLINNSKQANCDSGKDVDQGNCTGGSFTRWGVANDDAAVMAGEPGAIIVANTLAFGGNEFNMDEAIAAMERGVQNLTSRNKANDYDARESSHNPTPGRNNSGGFGYSNSLELAAANFAKTAFAKLLELDRTSLGLTNTMSYYTGKANTFFTRYNLNLSWAFRRIILNQSNRRSFRSNAGYNTTSQEGTEPQYLWMLPMDAGSIPTRYGHALKLWYNSLVAGNRILIGNDDSDSVKEYKRTISALDDHVSRLNDGYNSKYLWFGNEPVHFNPFAYHFISLTDKATEIHKGQAVIRNLQVELYNNSIDEGLSGNDDLGCLTAWYVWSALGLYPAVPGVGVYTLSTPLFKKVVISKHDGRGTITISAPSASGGKNGNKYVKGIKIKKGSANKIAYTKSYIKHKELYSVRDVELEFDVGSSADDATRSLDKSPSFSDVARINTFLQE